MAGADGIIDNNLLRALRREDWAIIEPKLENWPASTGTVLHEPGDNVRYAYFPRGPSLISYFVVLQDGRAIETALVGREGAVGGFVSQGNLPAYARAEIQLGGAFFRIDLRDLEDAKLRSLTLRHLFARYTVEVNDVVVTAIQQSPADEIFRRGLDQFDRLYQEGRDIPRVMAIALHPYLTGVPHRIKCLEALYDYIIGYDGVVM